VVKSKRHSSSSETDQSEQPRKDFICQCQNSRPTCSPVEEQPQASGATGSCDVSANLPSMHKIIGVRESILLGAGRKKFALKINNLPKNNYFSLIRRGPETSCKSVLIKFNSFVTASSVMSICLQGYILFGPDGIFYMHFNSLITSIWQ